MKENTEIRTKIELTDLNDINQKFEEVDWPLEPLKVAAALNSEIMKFQIRKERFPKDISVLDYTIMSALAIRIPKEPVKDENGESCKCPSCSARLTISKADNFCQECGQYIKWEANKDYDMEDDE